MCRTSGREKEKKNLPRRWDLSCFFSVFLTTISSTNRFFDQPIFLYKRVFHYRHHRMPFLEYIAPRNSAKQPPKGTKGRAVVGGKDSGGVVSVLGVVSALSVPVVVSVLGVPVVVSVLGALKGDGKGLVLPLV